LRKSSRIQQVLPEYESYSRWQNNLNSLSADNVTQEDKLNFIRGENILFKVCLLIEKPYTPYCSFYYTHEDTI
jgi:hypothetical protein